MLSSFFVLIGQTDPYTFSGESLADQTVGSLALFKGQRVFVDLAHASRDVRSLNRPSSPKH